MTTAELFGAAAQAARAAGIPIDDTPAGPLAQWVRANCQYRPETEFYIVIGIAAAMADLEAQAEGYRDQIDRACQRAFGAR